MTPKLEDYLQEFDGVAVSVVSEARAACSSMPGYFDELIRLCADPRPTISIGATWILKAECDDGNSFGPALIDRLVQRLDDISPWQAQLHICQSFEAFEISAEHAKKFSGWAASLANHSRPLLRAWSLHLRVILSIRFEEFRRTAENALLKAEDDVAASVRARARNLRKQLAKEGKSGHKARQ